MSTLTFPMGRDCVNSLGIPVDNLSLQEAIDRIVGMALVRDGRAKLVSTLNVDFLVNALGFTFSHPTHPELLKVLRNSDMVTADGFPIVWLSRLAGRPLKQRVPGSDMVPALAQRAVKEDLSLFLLGGGEGVAAAAGDTLKKLNPGLKIAGTAAPMVYTAGPQLTDFSSSDDTLVEYINSSNADVLLVGLGNPKQELWFNRNQHKLKVPVSVGVGGTFEFITGTVKRAPLWVQKLNMEWLYRIVQEPGRLIGRYSKGIIMLGLLTLPLLYCRLVERLCYWDVKQARTNVIQWSSVWSSREQSLQVLSLPTLVNQRYLGELVRELEASDNNTALRILDFSSVQHVEISAHQELFLLAELLHDPGKNLSLLGLSGKLKRQLSACRVLDVLGCHNKGNPLSAITNSGQEANDWAPSCRSYVVGNTSLIFLAGQVDSESLAELGLVECMVHNARERICILDFRNVSLLESSAIAELHPVVSARQTHEGKILFSGVGPGVRQMFRVAQLEEPTQFISDTELLEHIKREAPGHE